jgi:hypothetical protein
VATIAEIRNTVEPAVQLAVQYWPNAHLGDCSPREDIRSAFYIIRSAMKRGDSIQAAAGQLEFDAYRHADM